MIENFNNKWMSIFTTVWLIDYIIWFDFVFFFQFQTSQNLQNSNIKSKISKMLPSVNDDGTPKHDKCMASHARKLWALKETSRELWAVASESK